MTNERLHFIFTTHFVMPPTNGNSYNSCATIAYGRVSLEVMVKQKHTLGVYVFVVEVIALQLNWRLTAMLAN